MNHSKEFRDMDLLSAARQGNLNQVSKLLQNGECPYLQTPTSDNALTISITYGHEQVSLAVLRYYERDWIRNFKRPIYIAYTQEEKNKIIAWSREKYTGDHGNHVKVLIYQNYMKPPYIVNVTVTKSIHLSWLNDIFKNGLLDVNTQNSAGCTALHLAAMKGFCAVTSKLLQLGANQNLKTKSGCCPIYYALRYNNVLVVDLLSRYADLSVMNSKGETVLHAASMSNNVELFDLMINAILKIEALKNGGNLSTEAKYIIRRDLLQTKNRSGFDVLHKSIVDGNDAVAMYILHLGPNVNEIQPMLKIAIRRRNMDLIQELLSRGSKHLFAKEEDVFSSLAGESSSIEILEELTKYTPSEVFKQHRFGTAEAFFNAIIMKNTDVAIRLIELGVSPEITDIGKNTPLHLACYWQNLEMVVHLLSLGVNPSPRNVKGDTPLHRACEVGNEEIIRTLLENGASVNIPNNNGDYPLHVVTRLPNGDFISKILDLGANPKVINKEGNTLLHCICIHGHSHLVKKVIDLGVDISMPNNEGNLAAQIALEKGQCELFKKLYNLDKGMDLEHRNCFGNTSLMIAAKYGNLKCLKTVLEIGGNINAFNTAGDTALHLSNEIKIDKFLIQMGADPMRTNCNGDTCYHAAAKRHNFEKLRYYLTLGLDMTRRNKKGQTFLHILLYFEHALLTDMRELLEDKYDDILIACGLQPDVHGNTILHKASNPCLLKKILSRCSRLDVNARDACGRTVIHNLIYHDEECLRCLLRFAPDIDPDAVDAAGNTPLHLAACLGRHKHVAILISAGAKVDERDARGFTPMHFAVGRCCVRSLRHLATAGADCDALNNDGISPIEMCNDPDCKEYFKCIGKLNV